MIRDMSKVSMDALLRSLRSLQDSGEYADLKIRCKDQVFSVHKALICPRSEFVAAACSWPKDENSNDEVDMDGEDPKMVKLMIDFLYGTDYEDSSSTEVCPAEGTPPANQTAWDVPSSSNAEGVRAERSTPPRVAWDRGLDRIQRHRTERRMKARGMWETRVTQEMIEADEMVARSLLSETQAESIVVNTKMYVLADKYGIEDLKVLATSKLSSVIKRGWKSKAFIRGAEIAFNNSLSSDCGLRDVVFATLYENRELTKVPEIRALLDLEDGVARQFLDYLLSRRPEPGEQLVSHDFTTLCLRNQNAFRP